jgi:hypothetical protein
VEHTEGKRGRSPTLATLDAGLAALDVPTETAKERSLGDYRLGLSVPHRGTYRLPQLRRSVALLSLPRNGGRGGSWIRAAPPMIPQSAY